MILVRIINIKHPVTSVGCIPRPCAIYAHEHMCIYIAYLQIMSVKTSQKAQLLCKDTTLPPILPLYLSFSEILAIMPGKSLFIVHNKNYLF